MAGLLAPENAPFLVAIILMIVIGALEGVSALLGGGISHHLESLIETHNVHGGVAGHDADGHSVLGWLHVGRAPLLVLLILLLMGFSICGLALQWALSALLGIRLPALAAAAIALAASLPFVRLTGGLIARYFPKDESRAISEDSFVGRTACVVGAAALPGKASEAKLIDEYGQAHYLLVEPDQQGTKFVRGDTVLIVRRASGSTFRAIRNPRPDLL